MMCARTPNTAASIASVSTVAGGPSATTRPPASTTMPSGERAAWRVGAVRRWHQQPGQRLEQRGLAGAVGPHQGGDAARRDAQRQALDHGALLIAYAQGVGAQYGCGVVGHAVPRRSRYIR